MREVMDSFNDPKVKGIVGVFSAQMAKTTTIENVVGYHAHHDAAPIMWVAPTLEIAEAMSKDRLAPMIRDTPALKDRFAESGSKTSGDTLLHKKFPGGHVTLAGANSFNSLASRPCRIVIGDEAAKWKANEKGSPFRQLLARIRAFWNSKFAFFSTPTDASPDNEFNQLWEQSDKRLFFVPCPHCSERVVLAFDDAPQSLPSEADVPRAVLRWDEDVPRRAADGRTIRRAKAAWFECLLCGGQIDDNERHRAVRAGEWRATQEFTGIAGFWGWTAMSPFCSAEFIASEWLGALGSTVSMQSVKNETLGLPWVEAGDAPDWKRLFDRVEDYSPGTVPEGALLLTAGVDVQADRLEASVYGWGRRRQCWLIDHQVFSGDPAREEVWDEMASHILGTVYCNDAGAEFSVRKLCVDSGYEAQHVYDWARRHKYSPVAVVKGGPATATATVSVPSPVEVTINGKRLSTGVKVSLLNVAHLKSELYGRLRLEAPNLERGEEYPEGYVHLCALPDTEEFCRQLTAEQLVTRSVKGYARREWEKIRPRNEALDIWAYARAAAIMLRIDRLTEQEWAEMEAAAARKPIPPAPVEAPVTDRTQQPSPGGIAIPRGNDWLGGRGGNWFGRR